MHVCAELRHSHNTMHPMGWLWLVGSSKQQVSFAKETYKRDDILQKRPMILRSLLTVATPYPVHCCFRHLGIDVPVLQNIDSFIGLFCKRDL